MKNFLFTGGAISLVVIVLFLGVLLSTLLGMFAGWVVGLFFADTILGIFAALGLKGFAMWQIGGFLGFVGAFFRTTLDTNKR